MDIVQPSYFAILPAGVRYDKKINSNAKLLYAEITALCQVEGYCWAPDSYFAQLYDVDERTVRRWIESLIGADYLRRVVLRDANGAIVGRRLYLAETLPEDPHKLVQDPMDKNAHTPMDKNAQRGVGKNVRKNNTRIRLSNKDLTDGLTDTTSDYLTESAGACAPARERDTEEQSVGILADNFSEYVEFVDALEDAEDDVFVGCSVSSHRRLMDTMKYLGAELASRPSVSIHGQTMPSSAVLFAFAKALRDSEDTLIGDTIRDVCRAVLSGRVRNQFGYLVSTLWTRLQLSVDDE